MVKLIVLILIVSCSLMLRGDGERLFQDSKTILPISFRVYARPTLSGANATSYEVARASITPASPTSFGRLLVEDDIITAGPDPNSQILGRNQGTVTYTGLNQTAINVIFNFLFTAGQYKGSSLTVVGRELFPPTNQEIPIVGGTGVFRLARGYAISNLYSYDPDTVTYVLIYDFYVSGPLFF